MECFAIPIAAAFNQWWILAIPFVISMGGWFVFDHLGWGMITVKGEYDVYDAFPKGLKVFDVSGN